MSAPIQNTKIQELIQSRTQPQTAQIPDHGADFQSILADRLKVSAHAQTRLESRDLKLDADAWERVMQGVDRAAKKGAKESLVLVDDVALIVSIKNRR